VKGCACAHGWQRCKKSAELSCAWCTAPLCSACAVKYRPDPDYPAFRICAECWPVAYQNQRLIAAIRSSVNTPAA
jgi:hypothetical protein